LTVDNYFSFPLSTINYQLSIKNIMANPANLTITELSANAGTNQPAVQTLDTAGSIEIVGVASQTDRLIIEAINTDDADATLTIQAGDNPPSHRSRSLAITLQESGTAGDKQIIGPFEASRFVKSDGNLVLTLAGGASPTVTLRIYRLPKQV
jgi:hypothetical protein